MFSDISFYGPFKHILLEEKVGDISLTIFQSSGFKDKLSKIRIWEEDRDKESGQGGELRRAESDGKGEYRIRE